MSKRTGKTDKGRVDFSPNGDETPKSARGNKELYQLWKFAKTLNADEIEFLVTKRKSELRLVKDSKTIKRLRTEILLLEDAHKIVRRKNKKY